MDYKIDVSLSTNEVYTLTFDYTFDESVEDKTIRLQIGDLMVETQDRRVVFKTTSSAICIKSNVRLENINLYEGNFEDYDQHGEYTKESYLKGMTLINLCDVEKCYFAMNNSCGTVSYEDGMFKLYMDTQSLTWQHFYIKTSEFEVKVGTTYTCVVYIEENSALTNGINILFNDYGTTIKGNPTLVVPYLETGKYVSTFVATETTARKSLDGGKGYDNFVRLTKPADGNWVEKGTLKYGVVILEGDFYDYFANNDIHYFKGIGCVKSPTITSIGNEQGFGKGGRL